MNTNSLAPSKQEEKVEGNLRTDPDKTLAEDDQDPNSGNIQQRFERMEVDLKMIKGKRFGLGIIMVHQRILICKVDDDSLVSGILKCGDQILQVEKQNIHDKSKCRKLLMEALSKRGSCSLSIIRPKTQDALCTIMEEIHLGQKPVESNPSLLPDVKK